MTSWLKSALRADVAEVRDRTRSEPERLTLVKEIIAPRSSRS